MNRATTSTIISQHDYLYDAYANRRQHIERIGVAAALTNTYTYDNLNRLLTAKNGTVTQDETFSYDPLGNLTQRVIGTPATATTVNIYDGANQLLEMRSGTATGTLLNAYVYDANGSLTKKCEGGTVTRSATDCTATGGTVTSLTYDTLDRLSQAVRGATTETYAYDQEGKRIRKVSAGVTTSFHYMGPDIYAEYGTAFTAQNAIYTHGPNWDDPIIRQTGTGPAATAKFYHQDGLGSAVAVSTAAGATDGTQRFDAWGNRVAVTGAAIPSYGYTGREPDASGLTYYRARYYDPTLRRFTQRDPIGYNAGDIGLYAYVGSNPVNFNDPTGEVLNFLVGAAANVVIGGAIRAYSGGDILDWKAIALDAGVGAATSGLGALAQARNISRAVNTLRAEGAVVGTAQKTGTAFHAARSELEAVRAINSGADQVFLNRAVGTATGNSAKGTLARRPDVGVVSGGRYSAIEVASKTDSTRTLYNRASGALSALPANARGGVDVIDTAFSLRLPMTINGTRTIGAAALPWSYGLGTAVGLDFLYQGGTGVNVNYFSGMDTGGAGGQTPLGVSPR